MYPTTKYFEKAYDGLRRTLYDGIISHGLWKDELKPNIRNIKITKHQKTLKTSFQTMLFKLVLYILSRDLRYLSLNIMLLTFTELLCSAWVWSVSPPGRIWFYFSFTPFTVVIINVCTSSVITVLNLRTNCKA